jgi:hypothetical protein
MDVTLDVVGRGLLIMVVVVVVVVVVVEVIGLVVVVGLTPPKPVTTLHCWTYATSGRVWKEWSNKKKGRNVSN